MPQNSSEIPPQRPLNSDRDPHSVHRIVPENWIDDVTPSTQKSFPIAHSISSLPPLPNDRPENFFLDRPGKINKFQNWLRYISTMDSEGFRNEIGKLSVEEITHFRDILATISVIDGYPEIGQG